MFWHSTNTGTVAYNGSVYGTLEAFRSATGHEVHGTGANPNLKNPAALDFHPVSGPAIDAADASVAGFALLDFDDQPPIDVATVANTGAGTPNYADRGALEASDTAPVASVTVRPNRIYVGTLVTADASASTDDTGIVSYRFEWGDGGVTTQAGPVASHAYTTTGTKTLRLTVTDKIGQTGSVTKSLRVR